MESSACRSIDLASADIVMATGAPPSRPAKLLCKPRTKRGFSFPGIDGGALSKSRRLSHYVERDFVFAGKRRGFLVVYKVGEIIRSNKGYSFDIVNEENVPLVHFLYLRERDAIASQKQVRIAIVNATLIKPQLGGGQPCYVSRSYDCRSPAAIASALIPASSALFAEMTATCQPASGWGRTWTSCPSSARPSLIISANSSAAILVFCMARFQRSHIVGVRDFTDTAVIFSLLHHTPNLTARFVVEPAFCFQ
jgi:hypothetical protein